MAGRYIDSTHSTGAVSVSARRVSQSLEQPEFAALAWSTCLRIPFGQCPRYVRPLSSARSVSYAPSGRPSLLLTRQDQRHISVLDLHTLQSFIRQRVMKAHSSLRERCKPQRMGKKRPGIPPAARPWYLASSRTMCPIKAQGSVPNGTEAMRALGSLQPPVRHRHTSPRKRAQRCCIRNPRVANLIGPLPFSPLNPFPLPRRPCRAFLPLASPVLSHSQQQIRGFGFTSALQPQVRSQAR